MKNETNAYGMSGRNKSSKPSELSKIVFTGFLCFLISGLLVFASSANGNMDVKKETQEKEPLRFQEIQENAKNSVYASTGAFKADLVSYWTLLEEQHREDQYSLEGESQDHAFNLMIDRAHDLKRIRKYTPEELIDLIQISMYLDEKGLLVSGGKS